MRSESAAHREPNRFCVPVLCFSSGIPVASAEPGRGRNFCNVRKVCNTGTATVSQKGRNICHLGDQGLLDGRQRYAWPDGVDSVEKRLEHLALKITECITNNRGWSLEHGQGYVEFNLS